MLAILQDSQAQNNTMLSDVVISPVVTGKDLVLGKGFSAKAYRHGDFQDLMDPLIMVDHYTMTTPTFGAHPHAGLSAVSLIFEDSTGKFNNQDSMGNDFDLSPGDLYWLKAGSGAVHDEAPRQGATIRGLQVFVNIPASEKHSAPASLHVKKEQMPVLVDVGYRVKVALGIVNGAKSKASPSIPLNIADGVLFSNGTFDVAIPQGQHTWLSSVSSQLSVFINGQTVTLHAGQSIAFANNSNEGIQIQLHNSSSSESKFALLSGQPINETFVQKGPLVASSLNEMAKVEANLAAGKFGMIGQTKQALA